MSDAITMYATGRGFGQSSFLMMTSPLRFSVADDTSFFLGFHMLFGFATELYLKAFLQTVGFTEAQLRTPKLRHDLEALWQEANSSSFPNPNVYPLVNYLKDGHKKYEYRYMSKNTTYTALPLNVLFEWLSLLDDAVETATGARASNGLPLDSHWQIPANQATWRL